MTAHILHGETVAKKIREKLQQELLLFKEKPHLVVFLSHPNPASSLYVKKKIQACQEIGITSTVVEECFESEAELIKRIEPYNHDPLVDGILVQFPLHPSINQQHIMNAISPDKDVDGAHPLNLGKLVMQDPSGFIPCTPLGIFTLLEAYSIPLQGKHVVVVGRSITVGKPLAILLSDSHPSRNATVTIAHRRTTNLKELCKSADVIIAAAGQPHLITKEHVKEGAVVIDVGTNRIPLPSGKSKLVGDVDFDEVHKIASYISPVPGGVGPMTVASLLLNTVKSFSRRATLK